MTIDTGGPAFPVTAEQSPSGAFPDSGMTLLDWFAGQAMCLKFGREGTNASVEYMSAYCYQMALAMLAERKRIMEEK